jgi:intein-encoded DNA endonuclease-like protein
MLAQLGLYTKLVYYSLRCDEVISQEFLHQRYQVEGKSLHDIAKELSVSYPTVRYWMGKHNIRWRERNYAMIIKMGKRFDVTKKATLSYILGVLLGDGYVYSGKKHLIVLNVAERDKAFAMSFKKALEDVGLQPFELTIKPLKPQHSPQIRITANSCFFVKWYKNLTMADIRSLVMESEETMISFIKGFYESEGCISEIRKGRWKGLQINIANTKKELILLVKEILERLGFKHFKLLTQREWNGTILYGLMNWRQKEVKEFINKVQPCIKRVPRKYLEV